MTHFGIICPPATGHLNTILPLAQELQKRGHRITLFGILDTKAQTLAAGIEFQVLGESKFPLGSVEQKNTTVGKLTGKAVREYALQWRQKLVPMLLESGLKTIKATGIEALLVDHKSKEGGTVAEILNIPFITICSALVSESYGKTKFNDPIQAKINEYRHHWNLPTYNCDRDLYSPLAQISHQPPEFDLPRTTRTALPKCFHFTGPYHTSIARPPVDFPWSKLTVKPLIYASMGTLQNRQTEIFQGIAQACLGFDIQLVISLGGGLSPESLPTLPGNPLVVGYAPQLDLLKKATLTITNAGLNTTLECLNHGVPIVAIPISYEQPSIASRLVWKGVAQMVTIEQFTINKLHTAIAQVLGQSSYQQNALKFQTAMQKSGGAKLAADIIEQAVSTQQPVLRQQLKPSKNTSFIPQKPNKTVTSVDQKYLNLLEKVKFKPIFILGSHRSGTTLLYKTLIATQCFNFVSAYHVIKYQELLFNHLENRENKAHQELQELFNSLEINDRVIDRVQVTPNLPEEYGFILKNNDYEFKINADNLNYFQQICQKIQFISEPEKLLLLKNPWDFANFMYIKQVFPEAKFIFIHRHPVHVINSKLKAVESLFSNYSPYSALLSKQYVKNFNNIVQSSQRQHHNREERRLRNATSNHIQETSYFLENIDNLSNDDYLSIRYEDICSNPEENILRLLQFLNLETQQKLDYHSLIAPRKVNLLPQVEQAYNQICQQFKTYCDYHNYSSAVSLV